MAPRATSSAIRLFLALGLAASACGPANETGTRSDSRLPAVGAAPPPAAYPGMYAVEGVTTDEQSGDERRIGGTVIIAGSGAEHTATFNLTTELLTREGPLKADLIGTGEGRLEANALRGTAETQMFLAAIPGLDPAFPWIPGRLGPRIVSSFSMVPGEEGAFQIEIATRGAKGEAGKDYGTTRTTLRAVRTEVPLARTDRTEP